MSMTHEERKNNTRIASAEVLLQNTSRRDRLVEAAQKEGFLVDCNEAFDVSLGGATGPEYWAITVYAQGKLDRLDQNFERRKLAQAWKGI